MKTITEMTRELGGFAPTTKFLKAFAALVRADEREECAKVCDELGMATNGMYERNHECAATIRARGNT